MGECPWVRNKGGGVGQRPAPGDIRTQGHSPPAFNLRGGPQAKVKKPRFLASPRSAAGRGLQPSGRTKGGRSEEHTSELQSLMSISYAVFCLKKKKKQRHDT